MQSLKRYAADTNRARRITESDILYLKEIQNTGNTDRAEIMEKLGTFKIYLNSYGVRHRNLVFCLGQNIVF